MELKSEFAPIIKGLLTRDPKKRWGREEIVSWLGGKKDIAVFFGEASDEIVQSPRKLRPYRFEGNDYFAPRDLAIPMAKKWSSALKDFESGAIRNWVARELGDKEMLALIEDVTNDKKLSLSEKLFEFFCRVDGDFPFIFRGILISKEYLVELSTKIVKKNASPEEEKFIKDIFELNIIKKYSDLNNDGSLYKLFGGVIETCYYFNDPADYAAAVLFHFSEDYKASMIEKIKDIFENHYILDSVSGGARKELFAMAERVCGGGQHSMKELIKLSKLDGRDHMSKAVFDSAVAGLKKKFIKLDEENQINSYKEMLSDEDWKLIMSLVRKNKVEHSLHFFEKITAITRLFDGGTAPPDGKMNEIYCQHNYTEISQLPAETVEPKRVEFVGTGRAKPRRRFSGMAFDLASAIFAVYFSLLFFWAISSGPLSLPQVIFFVKGFFFVFFLLYIPLFEFCCFATPGKMISDVAVSGPKGLKLTLSQCFFRAFARMTILAFYGYLLFGLCRYLFRTSFMSAYLNAADSGFFVYFCAGGMMEYVFMSYGRRNSSSYDALTGCLAVERKYDGEKFWIKISAALCIISAAFSSAFIMAPHFNIKTMSFGQYTWRYFIDAGAGAGVKYGGGKQEIVIAASNGDFELVKYLIYAHPESVNALDQNGYSALFFAAQKGNPEVVKLLLDNNAAVDQAGAGLETPLAAACANGNSKIIKMLCAKKANVNARNAFGQTPLMIAVRAKMPEAVKRLLEASAQLEARDANGFTPLLTAAASSDAQIFKYLLSKGADVKAVDFRGNTALIIAAGQNNIEIAEILSGTGCDINARGEDGNVTPLIAAIQNGNYKFAEMLIDRGANVNLSDNQGNSPLMIAAAKGSPSMVTALINRGAEVNHQSYTARNTALMVATSSSNEEIINILMNAGADAKLRNSSGRTALDMLGRAHGITIETLRRGGR